MDCPPPSLLLLLLLLLLLTTASTSGVAAQSSTNSSLSSISASNSTENSFKPSIVVVIGMFCIMFTITFLLLMYSKFCHSNPSSLFFTFDSNRLDGDSADHRTSGIDKAVIEALPFFRFSDLKGSREGLECSVCLCRYEDNEMLRLLPRCKHAFHMNCIDCWFNSHSSCPLCRTRVDAEDPAFFKLSASSRYVLRDTSSNPAAPDAVDARGDATLDLYVERQQVGTSSRHFAASFHWVERLKKGGGSLLPRGRKQAEAALHNLKHRIIVSDVVFRSRWSDFNSADLINLDSEMLRSMSSIRFDPAVDAGGGFAVEHEAAVVDEGVSSIREEMERKSKLERKASRMRMVGQGNITTAATTADGHSGEWSAGDTRTLISTASRSISDITTVTRHESTARHHGEKEERIRQMWLPIARRTVQWFAGKEMVSMTQPRSTGGAADN